MILVAGAAPGQTSAVKKYPLLLQHRAKKYTIENFISSKSNWKTASQPNYLQTIAPDFYADNLGFFCRQEIKLDKVIKIPFRFRLGSIADCDRLEGKPNTYFTRRQ